MSRSLRDFDALSFDCYGTLIDWETGIWQALQPLVAAGSPSRDAVLGRFAALESALQAEDPGLPYPEVLAAVHRALAAELGVAGDPERDAAFAASIRLWPAFEDSAPALRSLASRYRLFVLSNVDRAGFAASRRTLGVAFDGVYTAEDIGSYKPDPANFRFLLDRLRSDFAVTPDRLLHVAQSLYHDHVPAMGVGLTTAWIDRRRQSEGGTAGATAPVAATPRPQFVFFSMAELASAVEQG